MVVYGMNLNPRHPVGQPADVNNLKGVKWARIVFQAAAVHESIEQAFSTYDSLIDRYNSIGMRTLLVVNQETFWGHGPWDNGDWEKYAREFAAAIKPIAERYSGKGVAYEIWNEGDIRGHSSIFVPPDAFAPMLRQSYEVIKAADPEAQVVVGGLAAGAGDAVTYMRETITASGGKLYADAIGIHPYGQWTPNFSGKPEWGGWHGKLADYLWHFINAFPNIPAWITEIGISEEVNFPPSVYPMVAQYMHGIDMFVRARYARNIPVIMWFAWSDLMRQAGIVDINNVPKDLVYEKFFELAQAANADPGTTLQKGVYVKPTTTLSVRNGAGTNFDRVGVVQQRDYLLTLDEPDVLLAKLGVEDEWLHIKSTSGLEGWSAAWYMTLGDVIVQVTDKLNVRAAPGTDSEILSSALPGDNLVALDSLETVLAKAGVEGEWLHIELPNGEEGYVAAWFVEPLSDQVAATAPDDADNTGIAPVGQRDTKDIPPKGDTLPIPPGNLSPPADNTGTPPESTSPPASPPPPPPVPEFPTLADLHHNVMELLGQWGVVATQLWPDGVRDRRFYGVQFGLEEARDYLQKLNDELSTTDDE